MTPRARNRLIGVLIVLFGAALAGGFALWGLSGKITYFYTPHELQTVPETALSRGIRVGGLVENGSLSHAGDINRFSITDTIDTITVEYKGILPDLFREGQGIVAYGTFSKENKVFTASEVLAKHDEKYMPPDVAKSMKKIHENGVEGMTK